MSFDIQVKVDPSQATMAAKQVGAELGKAEAAGVKAGAAIGASLEKAAAKGKQLTTVAKEADQAMKSLSNSGNMFDKLGGLFAAGAAGLYAGKRVIDFADAHTVLANKLGQVTDAARRSNRETMSSAQLYDRLYDVAQDTRQSVEGTTIAFVGLSKATEKLGISQEKTIGLTETINKLVAGTDAEQASAGLRQFGQAMASGVLQGDELKSIMENINPLAQAIADGLGVTQGELRKLGAEGKLTSKIITEALMKVGDQADATFAKSKATIGDRLTQAKNFATTYAPDFLDGASGNSLGNALGAEIARAREEGIKKNKEYAASLAQARDQIAYQSNPTQYLIDLQHKLADANERITKSVHDNTQAYVDSTTIFQQYHKANAGLTADINALVEARERAAEQERAHAADPKTHRPSAVASVSFDSKIEGAQAEQYRLTHGELGPVLDIREATKSAGNEQRRMNDLFREGKITAAEYTKVTKDLAAQVNAAYGRDSGIDYYKRVLDDILAPQRDFTGSIAALDAIMASGRITMQQYNDEFRKLSESYDKSGFAKLFNDATTTKMLTGASHGAQVMDAERRYFEQSLGASTLDTSPNLEADLAAFEKTEAAAKDLNTYLLEMQSTNAQWAAQQIEMNDHVGNAWDAMVAKATDVAGAMESVFTSAYQGIEDALTSLITSQTFNMQSFVNMMLEQMARLAIRSAISGIAGAFMQSQTDSAVQSIATGGALGDLGGTLFDPTWGGPSARVAQPTSPTIGPATTGGVSARQSSGQTVVVLRQDPDSLLPALDRSNGRRVVANIAYRDANPAKRPRYN